MLWFRRRVLARIGGLGMQRVSSTMLLAEEAGPPRPAQGKWRRFIVPLLAAAPLGAVALSTAIALELPKPEPAEKFLGKAVTGANYTIRPTVRSDGVMRIFDAIPPMANSLLTALSLRSCGCTNSMPSPRLKKCLSPTNSVRHSGEPHWAR